MALGVQVNNRTAPPSRGVPTDTGTAFLPVKTGAGALKTPVELRSLSDFVAFDSARDVANAAAYDWLDGFFREGGQHAFISRYDGTANNGISDAVAAFGPRMGPGQVAAPSETVMDGTLYGVLQGHAANTNRFALLDVESDDTVADMVTKGGLIPAGNPDYSAAFGPWITIPAPAGVIGGNARTVPASAAVAALCNRADALGNPNRAAAGRDFPLQYAKGFVLSLTDADLETLANAGVNGLATIYGVQEVYTFRTKVQRSVDTPFWQANCSRARMWLTAQAQRIGEGSRMKPIDGRGRAANALKHAIEGVCLDLYGVDGLYGETAAEAFSVEAGVSVNTDTEAALGVLHSSAEVRFSEAAESVVIDLVSVPVTGNVTSA